MTFSITSLLEELHGKFMSFKQLILKLYRSQVFVLSASLSMCKFVCHCQTLFSLIKHLQARLEPTQVEQKSILPLKKFYSTSLEVTTVHQILSDN
jgi:hypothetical protein